jgi:hypothetical protein
VIQASSGGAGPASNDSLVLFFEPDRVSLEPITGTELRYASDEILPEPHPSRVVLEPNGTRRIRLNDYRPNGGDTCLPPPADISAELVAVKKNVLRLWLRLLARETIALFMLVAVLGGLAFQVPVGWLSDRLDRRLVLAALGLGFAGFAVILVHLPHPLALVLPPAALLGGFMSTLYPVCVSDAHDRMDRVVASAYSLQRGLRKGNPTRGTNANVRDSVIETLAQRAFR